MLSRFMDQGYIIPTFWKNLSYRGSSEIYVAEMQPYVDAQKNNPYAKCQMSGNCR